MAIDYTTIEEIVNDFQLMIDDTSYDKEANIYQLRLLALQGLRELTFDVEQKVKTTTLAVDSTTLQCTLPADYVKLNRVGYKGDNGDFHPLGSNPNLSLDASVTSQVGDSSYDENNPYYHTDIGKKFGVGGGKNVLGYYRINRQDGTINFSSDVAGKTVFMEYISDGITSTPARDHIIRFTMKHPLALQSFASNVDSSFGISNNVSIKIPNLSGGADSYTFIDNGLTPFSDLSTPPSKYDVYANLTLNNGVIDTSIEIAQALTDVINEGHPKYGIPPANPNVKASNIASKVTVTISNLTSPPLSFFDDSFTTNLGIYVILGEEIQGFHSVESQEVVQLGSAGDVPKVHKFCEEALRSYMYYKYIQRKRGIPANEKQMAKRAYYNEKRLARARMMNFNKETAMLTSRKAFKQSPKI